MPGFCAVPTKTVDKVSDKVRFLGQALFSSAKPLPNPVTARARLRRPLTFLACKTFQGSTGVSPLPVQDSPYRLFQKAEGEHQQQPLETRHLLCAPVALRAPNG